MKKTKVSKRILSVLLAALMVITSIPLMAFNASAYSTLEKLSDSMDNYTRAMSTIAATSDKVYTKLKPAYDAYVAAQKQYDSLKYGGVDNGANAAADALNAAVDTMNSSTASFDVYKGTAVPNFSGNSGNIDSYYYSNLLSTPTATVDNRPMDDNELEGIKISMYYAPTVMLYDGVNETSMPVILNYQRTKGVAFSNAFYIYGCYPSSVTVGSGDYPKTWYNNISQTDPAMTPSSIWVMGGAKNIQYSHGNWKAYHPGWDIGTDFNACVNANSEVFYPMGTNNSFVVNDNEKLKLRSSTSSPSYWGMAINKIVYKGDTALTGGSKDYQPSWSTMRSYNTEWHLQVHHGTAHNNKLTVINYAPIREAMANFGKTISSYNLTQFKEGGLADLFAAMDAISAVKPMDYFTGKTDTSGLTSAINDLINNKLPKLTAPYTTDSEDYQTLRDTFDNEGVVGIHDAGNADNRWTTESWAAFELKYRQAQKVMSDVVANGYTNTPVSAKTANDELVAAKNALETVAVKVDSAELEAAIDELLNIADYTTFTVDTVNNALNVADAAKEAIWGSVDNYKNASEKLDDSPEAQAAVTQQTALVQQAMKDLRFSTENEVFLPDFNTSISLQALLDEYATLKPDEADYVGFTEYEEMYNVCKEYADSLPTREMLDYYGQSEEYLNYVTYLYEARQNLHITFIKSPDGTILKQPTLSGLNKNQLTCINYSNIHFAGSIRYPKDTVLLKTTHDAKELKYGESVMTWEARQDSEYQVLDSITFHDDVVIPEGYDKNTYLNEFHSKTWVGAGWGDSAIPADKADRYSTGNLTSATEEGEAVVAEMKNVKVISRVQVPLGTPYAQLGDGGFNYVNDPADPRITGLLAKTDANVEDQVNGGLITKSTGEQEQGVVTFTGDMVAHTPATTKYNTFAEMPTPEEIDAKTTADSYGIYGNTAFLYKWHIHGNANMGQILGYSYLQLADISSSCYVVDISYLVDLLDMVKDVDATPYTAESYAAFRAAFDDAKDDYEYTNVIESAASVQVGANNVATAMANKYKALYNAYAGLELKQLDVTFSYMDKNGANQNSVFKVTYNDTLEQFKSQIEGINPPTTVQTGGYRYTFTGWEPTIDYLSPITSNVTYTAQYDKVLDDANFTFYDTLGKNTLLDDLNKNPGAYSAAELKEIQNKIDTKWKYWDPANREGVKADKQDEINAETQDIMNSRPTKVNIDASVAKALEEIKEAENSADKDQFDVSILDSFQLYEEVVIDGKTYKGLVYTDDATLNADLNEVINAFNASTMFYDVYLNGKEEENKVISHVAFGTPVIVNGDGTVEVNANDIDKDAPLDYLAWYYSYKAPSTGSNQTAEKFMTTSPSLGFIVKGDTYLTTKPITSTEQGYAVKFIRGTDNKVFDVVYTDADGNFKVPDAPNLAFYTFSGYSVDGVTPGSTFQVTEDTTIVANYAPQTDSQKYTVNVLSYQKGLNISNPEEDAVINTGEYSYNQKVEISTADWIDNSYIDDEVYVWCEMTSFDAESYAGTFNPVYYGPNYSFYACKDVDIVAFTKTEFDAIYADVDHWEYPDTILTVGTGGELYGVTVEDKFVQVFDENGNLDKVSMIGTFVLPAGYKMVETGMLLGPVGSPLQLENTGVDGIKRAKSTKHTPGNQFVLSLKVNDANRGQQYDFAAYAVIELPDKTRTTFYSQTKTDTIPAPAAN